MLTLKKTLFLIVSVPDIGTWIPVPGDEYETTTTFDLLYHDGDEIIYSDGDDTISSPLDYMHLDGEETTTMAEEILGEK